MLAIDSLIGKRSDVYNGVMEFINNRKNLNNPSIVDKVETKLVEAFTDFIMSTEQDEREITAYLRK